MRDLKDTEELENLFRPYATQNAVGHPEFWKIDPLLPASRQHQRISTC